MIRFHQTFGTHAGRVVSFDATRAVITFGRLPDRDVPFDPIADIGASGAHGEVRRSPGAYVVIDTGSRNGTFVNGKRVDRAPLVTGDEIEFGPGGPRLRVEVLAAPPRDISGDASELGLAQTAALSEGDLVPPTAPGTYTDPPPPMYSPPPQQPPPRADPTQPRFRPPSVSPSPPPVYVGPDGLAPPRPGGSGALKMVASVLGLLVLAVGVAAGVYFALRLRHGHGGTTTAMLTATNAPTAIAAAYRGATYVLSARGADGVRTGLCTAFAVRPNVLATSARCVMRAESMRVRGETIELLSPGLPPGVALPVGDMLRHPEFLPTASTPGPDIGLVETSVAMAGTVPIATLDALHTLAGGDGWIYGYTGGPFGVAPNEPPDPAVVHVALAAPTRFDGMVAGAGETQLVVHDGMLAPGTVGGPVFDASGAVVAVECGVVAGRETAVRADVVLALLAGLGQ